MFLLDTNICIYAIKKKPSNLIDALFRHKDDKIYISSLTVAEIEFGISSSLYPDRNRIAFAQFLTLFDILDFTASDALPYGKLRTYLKNRGMIIGPIDMLLTSQALHHDLVMVTNNVKEFKRVPHLKVENWTV